MEEVPNCPSLMVAGVVAVPPVVEQLVAPRAAAVDTEQWMGRLQSVPPSLAAWRRQARHR